MAKKIMLLTLLFSLIILSGCSTPFDPQIAVRKPYLDIDEEYDANDLVYDVEDSGLRIEVIQDTINTSVPGDYIVTYIVYSADGKQHATKEIQISVADKDIPDLTVEDVITLKQGNLFSIADYASAQDTRDGDLKNKITYTGELNTFKPGEYLITVSVSDRFNNTAQKDVKIIVSENDEVNYVKLISGNYTDITYQSGQTPTLTLKEDGSFALYINGCSLLSVIEGKYIAVEDTIYLNSPNNPFVKGNDENLMLFTIQPNGTLLFNSEMDICAPNYDDIFVKDYSES